MLLLLGRKNHMAVLLVGIALSCVPPVRERAGSAKGHGGDSGRAQPHPSPTTGLAVPAAEPNYRGFPVTLPPLLSPELARFYDRAAHDNDPRNMFLLRDQMAPRGFRGISARRVTRFPGASFGEVRSYVFDGDQLYPHPHRLNRFTPGCDHGLVAKNGTVCPSAIYPGAVLEAAHVRELLAVISATEPPVPRAGGWPMTYGFLFFDGERRPVAQVLVAQDAGKITTLPPYRAHDGLVLGEFRAARLLTLLTQLGLREDVTPDLERLTERQRVLDGNFHAARWLPADSGVAGSKSMDQTSPNERKLLCAWQQQVWAQGLPPASLEGGIECESQGWSVKGLDWAQCQQQFPNCTASVGEVEACMRRQRFDPCLSSEGSRACRKHRDCFWGIGPSRVSASTAP
jgi:hypothetical protein